MSRSLPREEIFNVASELFIKNGYHNTTIREISKALGRGPGTIYNYVRKKEDILYLVYNKVVGVFNESALREAEKNTDPLERITNVLKSAIDVVWEY